MSLASQVTISTLLSVLLVWQGSATRAGEKASWQAEWEKSLEAAKKEGQLVLYAQAAANYEIVFLEFQKRYPEIKVKMVEEPERRVMAERRAGKYLGDLYLGGIVTPNVQFYRGKALEPLKPVLLHREAVDETNWWGGKHHYADPEGIYIFVFQGNVHGGENAYNAKSIKSPEAFKSYWDFLDPKWRGKIVALDPKAVRVVAHSLRFFYNHPNLGHEYVRRFFGEMELMLSRDNRQMIDWLAVGRYPIAFFISSVEEAAVQGLPIKMFDPNSFKEGAFVGPTQGSVALLNQAPHPNAAKVAINWLLSREGQITYQKVMAKTGGLYESMREDIPKDMVPLEHQRKKGVQYIYAGRPDWIDMGPVNKIVSEALGKESGQR